MKILVTGAKEFVGKNLCWALKNILAGKDNMTGTCPLSSCMFAADIVVTRTCPLSFRPVISRVGRISAPAGTTYGNK